MKKRSKAFISSSTFGKAFLAKAWEARDELLEYERRGFAQFFYLTICGHIESVLMNCIKTRLNMIESAHWEQVGPIECTVNNEKHLCPLNPVIASVRLMASRMKNKVETAPLSKLLQLYNEVFPAALSSVVGQELSKDLDALAKLRNIFAHGRDIFIEFEGEDLMNLKGTLDDNPLKYPAQRLQAAGIITSFNITGQNHHEFISIFFGDKAMLHFYGIIREVESALKENSSFLPEKMMFIIPELPELQA